MSVVDDALNYDETYFTHGTYQISRIIQQTGAQSVPLQVAGAQESLFEIPTKVHNWSKSYLLFNIAPSAGVDAKSNYLHADGFPQIRQIQLYTRTGLYLVDINDVDKYTNMIFRREIKMIDNDSTDKISIIDPPKASDGWFEGLNPCNTTANLNIRPTVAAAGAGKTHYLEPLYVITTANRTAASTLPAVKVRLDFDKMKNTLLAQNKDLYFNGELLYLRIVWNQSIRMLFNATDSTNPTAGPSAATAGLTIDNLSLNLAIETNPQIENMIKAKCMDVNGLQLLTPMIYSSKLNLGPSIQQTVTNRYNRAHGQRLLKIYVAAYNNTESGYMAFDKDNKGGVKIISFYTQINNMRTSQFDYNCINFDDWNIKRDSLKGSSIYSSDEYYYNDVWVEDFTDGNPLWKDYAVPEENLIDGLDLTNEIKYDFYANTTNTQLNWYAFAATQKKLIISPAGIALL